MQGTSKKKVNDADAAKMGRGLLANHDKIASISSLEEAGQTMLGSQGMDGAAATLGDVEQLAPQTPSQEAESEQEGEEVSENGGSDGEKEKEKKAKRKWWDRDRAVNRMHKSLRAGHDKLKETATQMVTRMESMCQQTSSLVEKDLKQVEGERMILLSRLNCLKATLATPDKLKEFIVSYDEAPSAPGAASASSDPLRGLGKAPPSRTFRQLETFSTWQEEIETALQANSSDELELVKSKCGDLRSPLADLVSAGKSAETDLSRGLKAIEKAAQERQGGGGDKTKKPRRVSGSGCGTGGASVFDLFHKIPRASSMQEGAGFDAGLPALVRGDTAKQRAFETLPCIKQPVLTEFLQLFNTQGQSQRLERANKRYAETSDTHKAMLQRMNEIQMKDAAQLQDEDARLPQDVKQAIGVQAVIVGKNTWKCTSEKHHLGLDGLPLCSLSLCVLVLFALFAAFGAL